LTAALDTPASAARAHWQRVYTQRPPDQLSWYEAVSRRSLSLVREGRMDLDAAILDVGGGASKLAAGLLDAGYSDVTVADISPASLAGARGDLGSAADRITWVEADVRSHDFGRRFDLWHDRALFHFMVEPEDRDGYLRTLRRSLKTGGHALIATFAPDGPSRCSGLPVARYDADRLAATLGDDFELVRSSQDDHRTPSGRSQRFVYTHLRRGVPTERRRVPSHRYNS
jgi:SAM-dependent methyltransferase